MERNFNVQYIRNENSGITLIALVISIIVMLILAGISLNAVIGDNGIITQAQNAKIATAVGSFNEYMQSWFFNKKMEDEGYNIEDLYVSAGWLERKLDIDDEGNAYYVYIIDKSKVTDEEILKYMQAGDGDPYSLQDVYGINSDFSIWYKDSFGNLINSQIKVLAIDDNTEVNFVDPALSQAIANAVGVDVENATIGNLKNVTTLKLNYDGTESDITNLNDLYYLPNLKNLYIYNLDLDNIDGNTTLDYSGIPSGDVVDGTITYVPDTVTTVNLTNKSKITNINFLKNKTNIKELNLSNCTGISEENLIEVLSTLTGIEILNLQGLYQLTNIIFINNMPKLYDFTLFNTSVEFTIATDANAIALNNSNITRLQIGYNGNDESKYKGNNIDLTLIQPCINKLTYSNGLVLLGNSKANEKFAEQLSRCTQLTQLTMRYYQSNIKKLDLSALTKLETLYLSQIYIDELDISGCINLKKLYLDGMFNGNYKFNKPDFSNLSQLETLSYTNNFMTSSEFNDMCDELANSKNLQTINLSYNSISNISNIGKLSRFTTNSLSLTMTNNNLSDISPIINCSRISVLNLKYNNLGNDTLDYLVQLYNENKKLGKSALYLGGNNITDYSPLLNLGFYEGNLTLP